MLIGLHGKLGCGKNTVAKIARELFTGTSKEIAFAAKLKESVAALLKVTVQDVEDLKNSPDVAIEFAAEGAGEKKIFSKSSLREFLQLYGTESHRNVFGQDFWVNQALPYGVDYRDGKVLYIVTDLRFQNEANRIRELGGYNILIRRPETDGLAGGHISEKGLPDSLIDYTIQNTGTPAELRAEVDRMLVFLRVTSFYGPTSR